ncbi:hypothetical protein GALMADRAFT_217548 [Galerina marginata CBS 339.88]|uniref:Uncharacterized protein n=1 Tax=Galerina marginata (strain CBS 339.88) TaxID=685588 RepID=A0A067S3R6_GALM3|nr:hypothetical protein GALMADRAFT_217548 [Galerina marginata CBS 339.88]
MSTGVQRNRRTTMSARGFGDGGDVEGQRRRHGCAAGSSGRVTKGALSDKVIQAKQRSSDHVIWSLTKPTSDHAEAVWRSKGAIDASGAKGKQARCPCQTKPALGIEPGIRSKFNFPRSALCPTTFNTTPFESNDLQHYLFKTCAFDTFSIGTAHLDTTTFDPIFFFQVDIVAFYERRCATSCRYPFHPHLSTNVNDDVSPLFRPLASTKSFNAFSVNFALKLGAALISSPALPHAKCHTIRSLAYGVLVSNRPPSTTRSTNARQREYLARNSLAVLPRSPSKRLRVLWTVIKASSIPFSKRFVIYIYSGLAAAKGLTAAKGTSTKHNLRSSDVLSLS